MQRFAKNHLKTSQNIRSRSVNFATSIHQTRVTDSNGDWDEDIAIGMGGVGGRGRSTIDSPQEFAVRTRINADLDVADASQLDFFYRLFTPEMFCYNSWANEPVCSRNFFFFFLAFAVYTIKAAREMNDVVFSSSCLQP